MNRTIKEDNPNFPQLLQPGAIAISELTRREETWLLIGPSTRQIPGK
jgi:hypothetical protein